MTTMTDTQGPVTQDDFFATYWDVIESVAHRELGSTHYISEDDVVQEICERVLKDWEHFKGRELTEVRPMLRRLARQFLGEEVIDYMYFTAAFVYTPAQVRHYLQTAAWADNEELADTEARVDLLEAWERLSPATRRAVYRRYAEGVYTADMTDAERKAANRGVDEITARLNRLMPEAKELEDV